MLFDFEQFNLHQAGSDNFFSYKINKSGLDLTGNSQRCKHMPIRQLSSFFRNIEVLSSGVKIHSIFYCKDYRHVVSTDPWLPDLTSVPPGLAFCCHLKFGKLFLGPLDQISGGSRISPRWGRQLSRGRTNIRFCQIFPQKLYEIERIWTPLISDTANPTST